MENKTSSLYAGTLPETGFVRIWQILGDKDSEPPIPAVFPVSHSQWWEGIKNGRYPQPVKLGPATTAWRVEEIRELIERLSLSPSDNSRGVKLASVRRQKRTAHQAA